MKHYTSGTQDNNGNSAFVQILLVFQVLIGGDLNVTLFQRRASRTRGLRVGQLVQRFDNVAARVAAVAADAQCLEVFFQRFQLGQPPAHMA